MVLETRPSAFVNPEEPKRIDEYEMVHKFDGPGRYEIARDPRRGYEVGLLGGYIPFHPWEVTHQLGEKFTEIKRVIFIPARLDDATETAIPSRWERKHWEREYGHIEFENEQYSIAGGGNSSNGHGSEDFSIKDVSLSKHNNRLVEIRPRNRKGSISVSFWGAVGHYHRQTSGWRGSVEITGDRPGKMVEAVVDSLNDFISEHNFPLWKAPLKEKK